MSSKKITQHGFTLLEALLSVAVFGVLAAGSLLFVSSPLLSTRNANDHMRGIFLAEEGIEAARSIRNDGWMDEFGRG